MLGSIEFLGLCQKAVSDYFNSKIDNTDSEKIISPSDIYIVWYCKSLQNHKALVSTNVADGMYYELTFNGNTNELYLDAYKKWENICLNVNFNSDEAETSESDAETSESDNSEEDNG